jgi:predicted alpha/beta-hydrolase family hydrolase
MTAPNTLELQRAERQRKHDEALAVIAKHLQPGVIISHTVCMGGLTEHVYTGMEGMWLCGYPTTDTFNFGKMDERRRSHWTNDIAPANVTHINRIAVGTLDLVDPRYLAPLERAKK